MLRAEKKESLKESLTRRLQHARSRADELFEMLRDDAIYDRPIPERHRLLFYLGHFEAFDWNLICAGTLGMERFNKDFDELFAFGIDPVEGELPTDQPADWPSLDRIHEYNKRVRDSVDTALQKADLNQSSSREFHNGTVFHVAIEHRLEHAETFSYLVHWLPYEKKTSQSSLLKEPFESTPYRMLEIPAGKATLGLPRDSQSGFGWDNEFDGYTVDVPAFRIASHNINNKDFLEFVVAGGYRECSFWTEADWAWKKAAGIAHPRFWTLRDGAWFYRAMFEETPLPHSWPAYVSQAEASAYARWAGKSLPTETQYHRAAYGTPEGTERTYPWGEEEPDGHHGNLDFRRWDPTPVGSYPFGNSAFGVTDMVGNGWEWTSTVFAPFDGFEALPFYPRYSANFFDGKHYVIKGGSARTGAALLRPSFRNWFQGHYPYIYSAFRLVDNEE